MGFTLSACFPQPTVPSPTETFAPTETPILTPSPFPLISSTPVLLSPLPLFTPSPLPSASPTPLSFQLCSPLKDYTFADLREIESQPFIAPRPGKDDGHHGVDFAHWQYKDRVTLEGVEVQSVLPGSVAGLVVEKYPYGNAIIIETGVEYLSPAVITTFQIQPGQSLYLLYAHLQAPAPFQMGDPIACGAGIGLVGNTGASGNPHLHLETRVGAAGATFASMEYYKTTSTNEERANYERWRFLGDFILFNPWELLNLASD